MLRGKGLKFALNISFAVFLIICSFRSEEYNSDTQNYFVWFDFVKQSSFMESFVAKMEPLHIIYINFSNDVLGWFLLENISILVISALISRRISAGLYSILISFELTLITSSFRYVLGVLFLVLIDVYFSRLKYLKLFSIFSGFVHSSAYVGLFFKKINYFIILVTPMAIYSLYIFLITYMDRIDVDAEMGLSGFKVLIVFFIIFVLSHSTIIRARWIQMDLNRYFVLMIFLFIVANTFFSMANRWMYICLFIFLLSLESNHPNFFRHTIGRIGYVISSLLIIAPMLAYNYSIIFNGFDPG